MYYTVINVKKNPYNVPIKLLFFSFFYIFRTANEDYMDRKLALLSFGYSFMWLLPAEPSFSSVKLNFIDLGYLPDRQFSPILPVAG